VPARPARRRVAAFQWAWLAGGDGVVLRHVPSEASFFDGLGMWVAGMAVVSGFGMTVAASQWWSTSIVSVLWVLPLWAVLYCLIERLVLKSFGTSWAWNLVLTIPRLLLSLAIALVIGLPMAQVIYSGSINDELSKTTTARIQEATAQITSTYGAKIALAQKEIAAAQASETRLRQQVTKSRFLADCEAGLQSCSQTHKLGRGPYYKRNQRQAAAAAAELKRARPQIAATIAANQRKIAAWRAAESSQIATRVASIKANRDFLARQAALERVQKASPAVKKYVEFFLAFLIAIDLVGADAQADASLQHRRRLRASRGRAPCERARRRAPPPGARHGAHAAHQARVAGPAGRRRAQDPGRELTRARPRKRRARTERPSDPPLAPRRPGRCNVARRLTIALGLAEIERRR
jgi:hypothetical protein